MSPVVVKLAPQAVVLAAALYWVWPNLVGGSSQDETKPAAGSPGFTAVALMPTFPQPPKRNPFGAPGADSITRTGSGLANPKAAEANAKTAATKGGGKAEGLVLNATCIVGKQRLAMIDGRLYGAQETLPAGSAAGSSYKIVDVLPYKVLLEREGKTLELTYSDATSHAATSPTPAAHATAKQSGGNSKAKSGGSKGSSTKKK
jgi:hypothetical protein